MSRESEIVSVPKQESDARERERDPRVARPRPPRRPVSPTSITRIVVVPTR